MNKEDYVPNFIHPKDCPLFQEMQAIVANPTADGVKRMKVLLKLTAERSKKRTETNIAEAVEKFNNRG